MQKVDWVPPKRKPSRGKSAARPFVEVVGDVWQYCDSEYSGAILVAHDAIRKFVPLFARRLSDTGKLLLASGAEVSVGRRKVRVHRYEPGGITTGGYIDLRSSRGYRARIYDVKPFLGNFYVGNTAIDMTIIRDELTELDLLPKGGRWYKITSIPLDVNLESIPYVSHLQCGPRMFYNYFGHTDTTVWYYDIRGAYLSVLAKWWPDLKAKVYEPRRYVSPVTANVLKIRATAIHGGLKRNRPDLFYHTIQTIRDRAFSPYSFRRHTDGEFSFDRLTDLDIGTDLGQVSEKALTSLTLLGTSTWWSPERVCYGSVGRVLTESSVLQHLEKNPFEPIKVVQKYFNWNTCAFDIRVLSVSQRHSPRLCDTCLGESEHGLHRVISIEGASYAQRV